VCVAFFAVFVDTPTQKDLCAVYLHLKNRCRSTRILE
jgi:hypothetical protein